VRDRGIALVVAALALGATAGAGLLAWHPWDRDGDGSWVALVAPYDCDDAAAGVAPGAEEIPLNGTDEDCDGRDSYHGINVLFLLVDALRPDFLPPYGAEPEAAPAIARLASESLVYEQVVAQSSCTKPSMPSMLTSRLPSQLYPTLFAARTEHVPIAVPKGVPTLPELLHARGYVTVGFAANPLLRSQWGNQSGFSAYRFVERPCKGFENYGTAAKIRELTGAWLKTYGAAAPFFLYLHLMDVHTKPCDLQYQATTGRDLQRRQYRERIAYADREIGRILDALRRKGLIDKTIVVLTADHGEELGDHSGSRHCQTLFEETIRIPLLVRLPGGRYAARISTPVRGLDVMPTLLSLLGIPFDPGRIEGVALPPFGPAGDGRPLVSQKPRQAALRHGDWKLIDVYAEPEAKRAQYRGARVLLFNLAEDPQERRNVSDQQPERVAELRHRLAELQDGAPRAPAVPLSQEERATLRALGYID
jgi:arylsulfatase A-like enzyme